MLKPKQRKAKSVSILNKPQKEVYLILDNIRSIHNVGAIFRTANAAGVNKVYLCGITGYPSLKDIRKYDDVIIKSPFTIDPVSGEVEIEYVPSQECFSKSLLPRIEKTALAAAHKTQWEYAPHIADLIERLKEEKIPIVAIEQAKDSINYAGHRYPDKMALVVGNEVSGISPKILELCNQTVVIMMHGACKSLNVSTVSGIILFEIINH